MVLSCPKPQSRSDNSAAFIHSTLVNRIPYHTLQLQGMLSYYSYTIRAGCYYILISSVNKEILTGLFVLHLYLGNEAGVKLDIILPPFDLHLRYTLKVYRFPYVYFRYKTNEYLSKYI